MREILRFLGNYSSSDYFRISEEIYNFTLDEKKQFIKGFADVTGYIRRSNYAFKEPHYRVYFEIPNNWFLVVDFCNLLKNVDMPVQSIDWAHPNMRDGKLKKYNEGKPDFWKKEHQIKLWANEYRRIGFGIIHKQESLDYFARVQNTYYRQRGINPYEKTHRFYWEVPDKNKEKPHHPSENDLFIPNEIRGKHYNSWKEIARDLGYGE